jgi:hypothetical protein
MAGSISDMLTVKIDLMKSERVSTSWFRRERREEHRLQISITHGTAPNATRVVAPVPQNIYYWCPLT